MDKINIFKIQSLPGLEEIVRKCDVIKNGFPNYILKDYSHTFDPIKTSVLKIHKDFTILAQTVNENVNIIFAGNVSAGKSSVINALLGFNILRSTAADTSRSFTRISGCSTNKVIFPNKEERTCQGLDDIKKCLVEDHTSLEYGDQVSYSETQVFIRTNLDILRENVFLYDSMGLNDDESRYGFLKRKSGGMDLLILVMGYIMNKEFQHTFETIAREIINIPIIVLINRWDEIVEEDSEANINNQKKRIEQFIKGTFKERKFTETATKCHMFYYISAKQYTKRNDKKLNENDYLQDDFGKFKIKLSEFVDNAKRLKNERINDPLKEIILESSKMTTKFSDRWKELMADVRSDINEHEQISSKLKQIILQIQREKQRVTSNNDEIMSDFDNTHMELFDIFDFWNKKYPNRKISKSRYDREEINELCKIFSAKWSEAQACEEELNIAREVDSYMRYVPLANLASGISVAIFGDKLRVLKDEMKGCLDRYKDGIRKAYLSIGKILDDSIIESLLKNRIAVFEEFLKKVS